MKSKIPLEKPIALSLQKIADWQLNPDPSALFQVDLPKLQRGFVWEPAKVINLWDSLLRGFPVGSLLLSEISEKSAIGDDAESQTAKHWLLDGQQRATSIAMGFYNPWHTGSQTEDSLKEKLWSLKVIPTLWLDLLSVDEDETKRFFPLLVTQSHPWGYKHDGSTLSWGERGDALGSFKDAIGDNNYTNYSLTNVFPWKAQLPVPMAFLLDCASSSQGKTDTQFWEALAERCRVLPKIWQQRYKELIAQVPLTNQAEICEATQTILDYKIYLNYLNRSTEINDTITSDDNSILFVRLNTGGVPLSGEELIFSLFKSVFPEAKDAVEKAAVGFMAPSRLFTLFVRLVSAGSDASKLHEPVGLGNFKRNIATDEGFKERLATFIRDDVAHLVARAKHLLIGNHQFRLPPALATRTINDAPDVFLALLYWLKMGGTVMDESVYHRAVLGCFTALSWFMRGNAKQKRESS